MVLRSWGGAATLSKWVDCSPEHFKHVDLLMYRSHAPRSADGAARTRDSLHRVNLGGVPVVKPSASVLVVTLCATFASADSVSNSGGKPAGDMCSLLSIGEVEQALGGK